MTRPLSEQNIVFSTNGPVQLDSHMQNNEIELLSHHIQKLKGIKILNITAKL